MSSCRRHRRPLLLRVFVLLWLALSVVAQPVLASLGGLHETDHGGAASHLHQHDGQHGNVDAGSDESGLDRVLHDLLHLTHCCGQQAAWPAAAPVALAIDIAGPMLAALPQPRHGDTRRDNPFRPPITT